MNRWLPKNKVLNLVFVLALLTLLAIDLWLSHIPELFPGGAKIGSLVHALSLAYISSYIFYIVVVHIKHVRDREHIDPYIALKTRQLVSGLRVITQQLALSAGADPNVTYPSRQQFDAMTKRIALTGPAPEQYRRSLPHVSISSWGDFFRYWMNLTESRIDHLFATSQFLEAEHVQLLLRIRESPFFLLLDMFTSAVPNQDCSFLSGALCQLSDSTKALNDYCEKHFSRPPNLHGGRKP